MANESTESIKKEVESVVNVSETCAQGTEAPCYAYTLRRHHRLVRNGF